MYACPYIYICVASLLPHIYKYTHMHTHIRIAFLKFIFHPLIASHTCFIIVFLSIKDIQITPQKPDALLTYQHHKENPSQQYTCSGHRIQLRKNTRS